MTINISIHPTLEKFMLKIKRNFANHSLLQSIPENIRERLPQFRQPRTDLV